MLKFADGSPLQGQHEKAMTTLKAAAELVGMVYAEMPGGDRMDGMKALRNYPQLVAAVFTKLSE